ncbi:hypothetical protein BV898_03873 [Hypsibius exemplaris]|uniref:Uncharacterized protein n=1 Tax=Hypsibius exemplaris TaxID=2072580 RepID=A0A1W0X3G0_HYPEX|nr:hypothetical protein BV898_03873 [Hypsibius exemplaris]
MDVTLSGPFQGVLTVKSTTCQIQVRLQDTTPMIFFIPYGEKCAIKVDRLGRAIFTLVIAEQKAASMSSKVYYDIREVTLLCTYLINQDMNVTSNNRLRIPASRRPARAERGSKREELHPGHV